jgi:hypothetical protein
MPKSMQSSRLSVEVRLDLPDLATRRGRKHAMVLPIPGVHGRGPQPCGCTGRRRSNVGEDVSVSRTQRRRDAVAGLARRA